MIIDKNTSPNKDLYYLGAKIIEILDSHNTDEYDYYELFYTVSKTQDIGLNLFGLVLDWLFILGIIIKGEMGAIRKCF
jgi:hypothetical protein